MALPASPNLISMDLIRAELEIPTQAPFNIADARAGVYTPLNPYSPTLPPSTGEVSLGSWHSYCHTCTTLYAHTVYREANHAGLQNFTSAANACAGTRDYPFTVYSSSSTLGVGSTLYYLNGTKYEVFNVSGGAGEEQWLYEAAGAKPIRMTSTSSNVIDAVDTCSVPTPSIVIGGFFCKFGQYNAAYSITISNPPSGYYVTVTKDSGSDLSDNVGVGLNGGNWYVDFDLLGSAGATLYYTLELRDSGGTVVASYSSSQAGQSWWQYGIGCTFSPNPF